MADEKRSKLTLIGNGTKPGFRLYRCECGTESEKLKYRVDTGKTKTCGCGKLSGFTPGNRRTHGMNGTPEYSGWHHIKQRCLDPNYPTYPDYGGRGVRICDGWKNSFESFFKSMGFRPSADLSIDRIDNDGHYSCGECAECRENGWSFNCRWTTKKVQQRNRRSCRTLTIDGVTKGLAEWAEEYGIRPQLVWMRVFRSGWTPRRALTTPAPS